MDRSTIPCGTGCETDGEGQGNVVVLSDYRRKRFGSPVDDPLRPSPQAARAILANRRVCSAVAGRPLELSI